MQCKNMHQNTFWKLSWCRCRSSPEAKTWLGTRWGRTCTDSQPPPDSTTTPLLTVATLGDFIVFAETDVTQHKAVTKCLLIAPKQGVFLLSHHSHVRFRNVWNSPADIPHPNSSRKVSTHKFQRSLSVKRITVDKPSASHCASVIEMSVPW